MPLSQPPCLTVTRSQPRMYFWRFYPPPDSQQNLIPSQNHAPAPCSRFEEQTKYRLGGCSGFQHGFQFVYRPCSFKPLSSCCEKVVCTVVSGCNHCGSCRQGSKMADETLGPETAYLMIPHVFSTQALLLTATQDSPTMLPELYKVETVVGNCLSSNSDFDGAVGKKRNLC